MNMQKIPVPDVYTDSADFRFFQNFFVNALTKIEYDTTHFLDLYDPLRCPDNLLWCLADTIGYKYDDRVSSACNRLIMLYFMKMIYNRGSLNGVTLAAQANLTQFTIESLTDTSTDTDYSTDNIHYHRLDDTSLPANAAYVTSDIENGVIDIVYFSTSIPLDLCLEYVRPLGMYCFQHAGVKFSAKTKVSIDVRLANIIDDPYISSDDYGKKISYIADYGRDDYARMQKSYWDKDYERFVPPLNPEINDKTDIRNNKVYNTNPSTTDTQPYINAGYRALHSLQLSNNEHVVSALVGDIFDLGMQPNNYTVETYADRGWNLTYDRTNEEDITATVGATSEFEVETLNKLKESTPLRPYPRVNPIMATLGDKIYVADDNSTITNIDESGTISIKNTSDV